MESINLQPEEHLQLLVLPLGFEEAVIEKLERIFQLSRPDDRRYSMTATQTEAVDIVLVNYDNPIAVQQKDNVLAQHCRRAQLVGLSQGPLTETPRYYLRGILTAVRLLSLLDKVPVIDSAVVSTTMEQRTATPTNIIPLNTGNTKNNAGYRALIVDDSVAIQKSIELRLRELPQITVIDFADDGENALAKIASGYYDLIFLDVMMPGIDGYQTCSEIRKDARYKKTPIIMVSGKSSPLDEVKGIIAGCTTYLIKPIQQDAFHKLSVRVLAWLAEQHNINETAAC